MPRSYWLSARSSRGLRLFVVPPSGSASQSWVIVLCLTLLIAAIDYAVGIQLSLSIFYLIPVSLASGWLGVRSGILVSVTSTFLRVLGDQLTVFPDPLPGYVWWNVIAPLLIFLFVVWLVNTLVGAYHALEGRIAARTNELAESIAERRRLEIEVLNVGGRERAAFGRELHDDLGQHLVATALAAKVLAQQLGSTRGGEDAQSIVRWLEVAIAKTRKLARGLLVANIEPSRFFGELDELAANVNQGGVHCRVSQQGEMIRASSSECAQLFRIAQEAIGNALRHGRPRSIDITLATDDQATCLIIADDGKGFVPDRSTPGMGLRIMEHRAQIIGASLAVLSTHGEGTKVVCRLAAQKPSR